MHNLIELFEERIPEKEEVSPVDRVCGIILGKVDGGKWHEEAGEGAEAIANAHESAAVCRCNVNNVHCGRYFSAIEGKTFKFETIVESLRYN